MTKKVLVHFIQHIRRMGTIESLSITDLKTFHKAMGKRVCYSEVLGKYSEIWVTLTSENTRIISDDQKFIEKLEALPMVDAYGRPRKSFRFEIDVIADALEQERDREEQIEDAE